MPPMPPNGSDVLQCHKALPSMPRFSTSTAATMAAAAIGCEDLSEPDSGTAPITPLSRIPPSSANKGARRSLSRGNPFQEPRPSAHQRRTKVAAAAGSIAARFKVRKVRIASTGWIGLQDHGIPPDAATGEHDQL